MWPGGGGAKTVAPRAIWGIAQTLTEQSDILGRRSRVNRSTRPRGKIAAYCGSKSMDHAAYHAIVLIRDDAISYLIKGSRPTLDVIIDLSVDWGYQCQTDGWFGYKGVSDL